MLLLSHVAWLEQCSFASVHVCGLACVVIFSTQCPVAWTLGATVSILSQQGHELSQHWMLRGSDPAHRWPFKCAEAWDQSITSCV